MGTVTPIREQLTASLIARNGIPAGQTVGSFIEALRAFGEDTPLASVEFGISQWGNGRLVVDVTPQGLEIREGKS
jgi:hypothetical protein